MLFGLSSPVTARIGSADRPVVISIPNSYSAAAGIGFTLPFT
jgi:NAD/NADP transhydrogenase beta subunit